MTGVVELYVRNKIDDAGSEAACDAERWAASLKKLLDGADVEIAERSKEQPK